MSEATEQDCTVQRRRKLSATQQSAIVAAVASGLSQASVAEQFGVHRNTVQLLCRKVRNEVQSTANPLSQNWRESQVVRAVRSVNRALDDDSDTYKSANVAVQALKGLGVYAGDNQVSVNVANWLSSKPAGCEELEQSITTTACDGVPSNGADDSK